MKRKLRLLTQFRWRKEQTPEDDEDTKRSQVVEEFLKTGNSTLEFKVLLLGSGESGKSTILKQLRTIYRVEFSTEELNEIACSMHVNSLQSMQLLIAQCKKENIPIPYPEEAERISTIEMDFQYPYTSRLTKAQGEDIFKLWNTDVMRELYDRRGNFWIMDSAPYYFDNVLRFTGADFVPSEEDCIMTEDFMPTEEDCIMSRIRTTGITETAFDEPPIHFRVVDVAGQRGERKKWINFFDDVKGVIFVVNLAGYNSVMWEDREKNQMEDSLELFREIANLPNFQAIPTFLFLNKKDIFEEQLRKQPLQKTWPEYTGSTVADALDFLTAKFHSQLKNEKKELRVAPMAARWKRDVKYAWEEIRDDLVLLNKKQVDKALKAQKKKMGK